MHEMHNTENLNGNSLPDVQSECLTMADFPINIVVEHITIN